jgi:hypothetical protein
MGGAAPSQTGVVEETLAASSESQTGVFAADVGQVDEHQRASLDGAQPRRLAHPDLATLLEPASGWLDAVALPVPALRAGLGHGFPGETARLVHGSFHLRAGRPQRPG